MNRCVILGAAPFENAAALKEYLYADDVFVAADGGCRLAAALGVTPVLTVADCDSATPADVRGEWVSLPIEKDVTDTRAALDLMYERGCREFLLLGCLGGRLDHTIANLLSARQLTENGASVRLVDEKNEVTVLLPGTHTFSAEGFSVFAMGGTVGGLSMTGVQYPLENFSLSSDNPLCVSNHVTAKEATLSFANGVLLLIFSKD